MNKVLALVYLPLLEEEYDVFLPINKKIGTVKKLIIDTIFELSEGNFKKSDNYKLYDRETGKVLDNDCFVKDFIVNGTKLIML